MMFINDEMREPTYDDLRHYIFKNYGYSLTDDELELVIKWFERNRSVLTVQNIDGKIRHFLYDTFPNRILTITHDDSSNIDYLYAMLSSNIKKK